MSLSTITNQIVIEVGNRQDMTQVIHDQTNYAILEVTTTRRLNEMFITATTTTQASDYDYLLPSDLYSLFSVRDNTKKRYLEKKSIETFDNYDRTATAGDPLMYARFHSLMYLFNKIPEAGHEMEIRYWQRHPELLTDADNHHLTREYERGIRLKAASWVLRILGQEEKANEREQEYMRWMAMFQTPGQVEDEYAFGSRINFGSSSEE